MKGLQQIRYHVLIISPGLEDQDVGPRMGDTAAATQALVSSSRHQEQSDQFNQLTVNWLMMCHANYNTILMVSTSSDMTSSSSAACYHWT